MEETQTDLMAKRKGKMWKRTSSTMGRLERKEHHNNSSIILDKPRKRRGEEINQIEDDQGVKDKEAGKKKSKLSGDWNDLYLEEHKQGGRTRTKRSLIPFQNFIGSMGMTEIHMEGYQFTWCNNREEGDFVEEKLDNAFGSLGWLNRYPATKAINLFRSVGGAQTRGQD
ncbi:DNAse I-like superfamily protein [Striga asiatica]|uniref:DNAse I-like superfamily protein n=1 Tax=Striga asiatica TaxID=4170 RepID=A0A5A7PJ48_STRAF|nr:DNAse I-like superfamily protein [Striga asiatica]